ncbi:glycosyltransferase family 39 protein [Demequina sp. TTPB684]|uniref:ArnT family glycosyltransferase n=1 Tax=unclassified Demequina TaxID=2620311 RepID=UPI001CF3A0A9|nr:MULTISPECIES: glycosyltransferase family 39 protein [unclassified Demequina]MCB2413911.1 glycosyltransferase family 39 protein [Demequina sp. TTPB684]UPU89401.1 glycosyltransferase family 39 protein [Demequina sp. TMPB413]
MAPDVTMHPDHKWPGRLIDSLEHRAARFDDSIRSRVIVGLVYVFVSLAVVIPVIFGGGQAMSRIDEPTHADLAYEISHFRIPAKGSEIAPEIRDIWACMGQERYELPDCGSSAPAWRFPYDGENYNFSHPPLYYALVGFPARVVDDVTELNFVEAARLSGILWLAGGMFMLFVALRRWKVDPAVAIVAPLLLVSFPRVLHASTTVNPDAVAPLAGALALWLAARIFLEQSRDWVLPTLFIGLVGLTKFITTIPFIALAVLVVVRAIRDKGFRGLRSRDAFMPGAMASAILVPYVVWETIQAGRGDSSWTNPLVGINTRDVMGLPGSEWIETLFVGFNLASDYYIQPPLDIALLITWTRLLNMLVIGAMLATVVAFAKEPERRSLGWLLGIGAVLYPLAVQIQAYGNTAIPQYFPNPTGRYGLALIPGAIACLVMAATKAGYRRATYVLAVAGLVVVVVVVSVGLQRMPS